MTQRAPKVIEVIALQDAEILVFFDDGETRKFDTKTLFKDYPEFRALSNYSTNCLVRVEPGGYGVSWTSELDCSEGELYNDGVSVDVALDDFYSFVRLNLVTANQAANLMKCSKQNIADLSKRNKVSKIRVSDRVSLYSKSEILSRRW